MKRRPAECILKAALLGLTGTATHAIAGEMCPWSSPPETNTIKVSARHFSGNAAGQMRLSGAVQVEQGDNRIRAKRITYDPKTRRLRANGNVHYTNCTSDNPTWFLAADQLTLNHGRGSGTVKNAWLVVNDTPLIYLPRYRILAERERRSGFLAPDIATSSDNGVEFGIPYYFNLAPNHDLTMEPRILSKRGLLFAGKYRYLHRFHEGTLRGNWLDDRDYIKNNRYSYSLDHLAEVGDNFRARLQLQKVSDTDYVEDLGGSFASRNENYINSRAIVDYAWRGWHLNIAANSLQLIDDDTPRRDSLYEKKPGISLTKSFRPRGFELNLRNEWIRFNNRHVPANGTFYPDGERFDSETILRWAYHTPGFHLTPSLAWRYTDYSLDGTADKNRSLPWFSLHSGLVFEKHLRQNRYRHTLEPRLFYLNVPYRQQNDFPVFDTGESEFRFARLFEANRYNGADRIGDADRLTLGLVSRLIHSRSGREMLRLGIAHSSYFSSRKVNLPDENTETSRYDYSDLASEFSLNLSEKARFTSSLIWDTEEERPQRYSTRFTMKGSGSKKISLAHHYRRESEGFNQSEISFNLPTGSNWDWFGGWRYDLRARKNIGVMAGFVYKTCCWDFSFSGQRLLRDVDGEDTSLTGGDLDYSTRFGIEFSLRGLSSWGINDRDRLIENWDDRGTRFH